MAEQIKNFIQQNLWGKPLIKISTRYPEFYERLMAETAHMDSNCSISERIWNVYHDFKAPTCANCGKPTRWKNISLGYAKYCSHACSNASEEKKTKIKSTMVERYGVEHALQSTELLSKSKATLLSNYGVDSPLKSPEIKQKLHETNKLKYGSAEFFSVPSVRQGIQRHFFEKYGSHSPASSPEVLEKIRATCIERYGTPYPITLQQTRLKMLDTNGYSSASQKHLYDNGAIEVLNDKEQLQSLYDDGMSLVDIASMLNCSDVTVGNYFRKHDIKLRNMSSSAEIKLGEFIKQIYSGQVILNSRDILDGKEIDIYLPELKIAVEYCGVFWHSDKFLPKDYHKKKLEAAERKGIRLITIFEDEWKYKTEIVKDKLAYLIGKCQRPSVYARNTTASVVTDISIIRNFLNANHIQGYVNASKHVALYHAEAIVAIASLKITTKSIEIVRYCTSKTVVGGFSKIMKYIERLAVGIGVKSIITFADLRWSRGELYENNGFEKVATIPPDYRYVIGDKTFHKFNFRHKKLKQMPKYDAALSERLNTKNMNIHRIYDCGKIKYEKRIQT